MTDKEFLKAMREKNKINGEVTLNDYKKIRTIAPHIHNIHVGIDCKNCGEHFSVSVSSLTRRLKECSDDELQLCSRCYRMHKEYDMPYEIAKYKNIIPWNIYIKYAGKYNSTKLKVNFICSECGSESISFWDDLENRIYFPRKPICKKCILKKTTNTNQWRETNSAAQRIAQNRPDVIEKQRKSQRSVIERGNNEDYIMKRTANRNGLCGYKNGIPFNGSYELGFMHWADLCGYTYNRSKDIIEYYHNSIKHTYRPDFWLNTGDKLYLVEVKGFKNELVKDKEDAAIEYVKLDTNQYDGYLMFDDNYIKTLKNWKPITSTKRLNEINFDDLIITSFPRTWENKAGVIYKCDLQK